MKIAYPCGFQPAWINDSNEVDKHVLHKRNACATLPRMMQTQARKPDASSAGLLVSPTICYSAEMVSTSRSRFNMRTSAIFGWVLSLALLIGIAGPLFGTCTQGDDDGWLAGLLIFAPLGLIGLAFAAKGSKLGPRYSWLAAPHIVTLILGIQLIPTYFSKTTLGGLHVCSVREGVGVSNAPTLIQLLWAPAWLAILVILGYVVLLYWRKGHAALHS